MSVTTDDLRQTVAELRQAIEDLEADGDVDGDELDAIADMVFGAFTTINAAVIERRKQSEASTPIN